ncbi:PIN domain-containing protein [Candidatus Daviesbacteria bacterium]|nr:PIN domain-containing protein [Candidatus Daviesbacteria bacterium]
MKNRLVGLDTNVLIYYFEQNPQFGNASKGIFDKLSDQSLSAVTGSIAVVEILAHRILSKKDAKEMEDKLFDVPNLIILELNREIATEAARIRREHKFSLPDSIQLATALDAKAQLFITNDENLKKFKELKIIMLSQFNNRLTDHL